MKQALGWCLVRSEVLTAEEIELQKRQGTAPAAQAPHSRQVLNSMLAVPFSAHVRTLSTEMWLLQSRNSLHNCCMTCGLRHH